MAMRYALTSSGGKKARKHILDDHSAALCPAKADKPLTPEQAEPYETCGNCQRAHDRANAANATDVAPPDAVEAVAESTERADDDTPAPASAPVNGRVTVTIPADVAHSVAREVLDDAVDDALVAAITTAPTVDVDGVECVRMKMTPTHAEELQEAIDMWGARNTPAPVTATPTPSDAVEAPLESTEGADTDAPDPDAPEPENGDPATESAPDATEPEGEDASESTEEDAEPDSEPEILAASSEVKTETEVTKPRPKPRKAKRAPAPDVPQGRRVVMAGERLIKYIAAHGFDPTDPSDADFIDMVNTLPVTKMGAGGRIRLTLTPVQVNKLINVIRGLDAQMDAKKLTTKTTGFRQPALHLLLANCEIVQ